MSGGAHGRMDRLVRPVSGGHLMATAVQARVCNKGRVQAAKYATGVVEYRLEATIGGHISFFSGSSLLLQTSTVARSMLLLVTIYAEAHRLRARDDGFAKT